MSSSRGGCAALSSVLRKRAPRQSTSFRASWAKFEETSQRAYRSARVGFIRSVARTK